MLNDLCSDSGPRNTAGASTSSVATADIASVTAGATPQPSAATAPALVGLCARMKTPATLTPDDWVALRQLRDQPTALEAAVALMEAQGKVERGAALNLAAEMRKGHVVDTKGEALPFGLGLANISQDSIIRGLTDYTVERAKAQAVDYVKRRLVAELCPMGDDTAATAPLWYFPASCEALTRLDPQLSVQAIGSQLRASALKDIEELPERILIEQADTAKSTPASLTLVTFAYLREMRRGRSALELLVGMSDAVCKRSDLEPHAQQLLCATGNLSGALVSQPNWMSYTQSPEILTVAVVLAYEKRTGATLPDANIQLVMPHIGPLVHQGLRVSEDVKRARGKDATAADRAQLVRDSVALFIAVGDAATALANAQSWNDSLSPILTATRASVSIAEGDVGSAVVYGLDVLRAQKVKLPKVVEKGAPLLAELANAKSSDEVVKALEAAAAPIDSYESRYQRGVVALGAILGAAAGPEWVASDEEKNARPVATAAVFTPVGLHATTDINEYVYVGGFFSVIDIGSLSSTRLSESEAATVDADEEAEVEQTPALTFEQVFSPGGYVTLGLFGSPFVLGAGVSAAPSARTEVTTSASTDSRREADLPAIRALGFLGVDVVFLPF